MVSPVSAIIRSYTTSACIGARNRTPNTPTHCRITSYAVYPRQLESARLEAQKIREEARLEGEKILADFKDRANAESARITENAHRTIEAERSAAVVSLRNEVGALATTLAAKIVGESLDDDARSNRVVDRFLADLEQEQERNAGAAR